MDVDVLCCVSCKAHMSGRTPPTQNPKTCEYPLFPCYFHVLAKCVYFLYIFSYRAKMGKDPSRAKHKVFGNLAKANYI